VAAEIHDFLLAAVRYYKNVEPEDCRVILLHSGSRLLPELSESLAGYTLELMHRRGIQVYLNVRANSIEDGRVRLNNGEFLEGGTIVTTIGTATSPLVRSLGLPLVRGRIRTAPDMSVPEYPGLWAIGDCAAVPNARDDAICPPTAQFAEQQARQLALNIQRAAAGRQIRPFSYRSRGQLASIGHRKAVARLFGMQLSGFVAWLLWRGIYLLKIPTLSRKVRIYLEWNWAMLFPPDIAHLGFERSQFTGREG